MPPDNSQHLTAAYIVAGVIYVAYAVALVMRAREVRRRK
jgi:hypothetical protein